MAEWPIPSTTLSRLCALSPIYIKKSGKLDCQGKRKSPRSYRRPSSPCARWFCGKEGHAQPACVRLQFCSGTRCVPNATRLCRPVPAEIHDCKLCQWYKLSLPIQSQYGIAVSTQRAKVNSRDRSPTRCRHGPTLWTTLIALGVRFDPDVCLTTYIGWLHFGDRISPFGTNRVNQTRGSCTLNPYIKCSMCN